MPDPLLLPSIALLAGGALTVDYMRRRFASAEDRYMALYGQDDWAASNMDLVLHFPPEADEHVKRTFAERLANLLEADGDGFRVVREIGDFAGDRLLFRKEPALDVDALFRPRRGVYFETELPGRIRVVWNHMQTDGVGLWNALRPLFDTNPPLVTFRLDLEPPPLLPELMALPAVARRLVWRGRLRKGMRPEGELTRGFATWSTDLVKKARRHTGGPHNLVASALVVDRVFRRHPDRSRLNVGMTMYFPFIEGRNKYGVFLCKVKRGSLADIVDQLLRQTRSPLRNWGVSAAQTWALGRMPDAAFRRLIGYYRRQVDVLVSNLPVGRRPITLGQVPTPISCHPWELTLPYYFLLIGTLSELHVSFTSRHEQDEDLLALGDDDVLPR